MLPWGSVMIKAFSLSPANWFCTSKFKCKSQTPYPLQFNSSIVWDLSLSFTSWSFTCSMCLLRVHFLLNILAQCGQTMPSTLWCLLMCDVKSAASWPHWGQGRFWRPATCTFNRWMFRVVLVANCWSQSGHFLTRDGMLNTGLSFFALDSFVELAFSFSSGMFTCKSFYIVNFLHCRFNCF